MRKLSAKGVKWLKISHLVLMVLMLGGIISSVVLRIRLTLDTFDEVYVTYKMLQDISDHVVRYGAQGLLITGILYSVWTSWGFFRYRWVMVKWVLFVLQTVFGIFGIDRWMVENLAMLETQNSLALSNPDFVHNHLLMQYGAIAQGVVTVFLICVSVFKPWNRKARSTPAAV